MSTYVKKSPKPFGLAPAGTVFVTISADAYDACKGKAHYEFQESDRLPDGRYRVKLTGETLGRLGSVALKGETPSDAILRVMSSAQ